MSCSKCFSVSGEVLGFSMCYCWGISWDVCTGCSMTMGVVTCMDGWGVCVSWGMVNWSSSVMDWSSGVMGWGSSVVDIGVWGSGSSMSSFVVESKVVSFSSSYCRLIKEESVSGNSWNVSSVCVVRSGMVGSWSIVSWSSVVNWGSGVMGWSSMIDIGIRSSGSSVSSLVVESKVVSFSSSYLRCVLSWCKMVSRSIRCGGAGDKSKESDEGVHVE